MGCRYLGNGEGAQTHFSLPPNVSHTETYGTPQGFPPDLLFLLPSHAVGQWQDPLKSPSSHREDATIHADGLLLFWPREGSSGNEVSGCSPGTQHRCFLSSPPKPGLSSPPDQACHTKKGCSSFNHVSKIQHSPCFPANKPPSSTTRPRGTGKQQQTGRCHRSLSCSSEQLLTTGFDKRAFF